MHFLLFLTLAWRTGSVPIVLSSSDSLCWHLHLPPLLSEPTVPDRWHKWRLCFYCPTATCVVWLTNAILFSSSSVFLPWSIAFSTSIIHCVIPIEYQLYTKKFYVLHHDSILWRAFFCVCGGGGGGKILKISMDFLVPSGLRFACHMQSAALIPSWETESHALAAKKPNHKTEEI